MKKEYDKKKKLVILVLVAVAVCLAGGLCFYLIKIGTPKQPEKKPAQQVTDQPEVTVPEIDINKGTATLEETETEETGSSGRQIKQPERNETETVARHIGSEQGGNDSEKPKTEKEAQPPAEKPEVKDTDDAEKPEQPPEYEPEVTEPEQKPEEPAGGSTNESGQVYVPGFGYVDQPGHRRESPQVLTETGINRLVT